ncbi:MATE family efflux transporter [Anaerococcus sp. Marseille-Q5996]|uniref:MATE family efflux transporter n=1 Tax=Anaerococcus sp. Marseille-Q5996 TaxID=2972769 RepID=UPI0021C699CF|nr:MATE family efflux transporter [Anaerococcus sp. Marseille-Q5996]
MQESKYFKRALAIAWPAVFESFFIALAGIIDTFMISSMGPEAIAAIGLTTQPKFLAITSFFAISSAVSALVARRQGEDNRRKANQTLVTALLISMIFVVLTSILMIRFVDPILIFAGSDDATHLMAKEYFNVIMLGLVFNSLSMIINAAHRGSGNTRIAFVTNLVSSIVNIFFNYLLIDGNLSFPALGTKGAAIATVIGAAVSTIMCFYSLTKRNSYLSLKEMAYGDIRISKTIAKEISNLAVNIFIEIMSMRIGFFITALTAARLGTDYFAVHNVGMNLLSLSFSLGDGMSVAVITLTGNNLGAERKDEAIKYGKACQQIGLLMGIMISIIFMVFGRAIFSLFFTDASIIEKSDIVIRYIGFIVIFQILQVIYGGSLRSAGDVRYTLFVAIISVTIVRSVATLVMVNLLKLGLDGIWIAILTDQASRFIGLRHRFKQGKWVDLKI